MPAGRSQRNLSGLRLEMGKTGTASHRVNLRTDSAYSLRSQLGPTPGEPTADAVPWPAALFDSPPRPLDGVSEISPFPRISDRFFQSFAARFAFVMTWRHRGTRKTWPALSHVESRPVGLQFLSWRRAHSRLPLDASSSWYIYEASQQSRCMLLQGNAVSRVLPDVLRTLQLTNDKLDRIMGVGHSRPTARPQNCARRNRKPYASVRGFEGPWRAPRKTP